jgi:putative FmdB family regulatory protein
MPLYDFACRHCDARFEARTGFDEPGPPCPECGAAPPERLISGFATSRSPGLTGAAARRSNASRRIREQARAERMAARKRNPPD